jgi:hypothetical protein
MIRVAGCWDIWSTPQEEYAKMWQFLLRGYCVEQFYMTPNTGLGAQLQADRHDGVAEVIELPTMADVIAACPSFTPVVLDEYGTTDLRVFEHPENALYLFGRTGQSVLETLAWDGQSVHIACGNDDRAGFLHPHQAACVVLYDRMVKRWP